MSARRRHAFEEEVDFRLPHAGRASADEDVAVHFRYNRTNSSDSRVFGAIKESTVVGRAILRVWPASRAIVIPQP